MRSRNEARRTGGYVDADIVLEGLQRKLDAKRAAAKEAQVSFRVRLAREAGAELDRLLDVVLEPGLARDGGDLTPPEQAMAAWCAGVPSRGN